MTQEQAIKSLLDTAREEIGYREKKTNAQLDDPAANAGTKNYTKYARELDALGDYYNGRKQGFEWCDVFVDFCFYATFGPDIGRRMIYQPLRSLGAGTGYSARYYKDAGRWSDTPQPGDQIFFTNATGTICHTGLVETVTGDRVTTIEGNSADQVRRCNYAREYSRIAGYGRPDWSLAADVPETPAEPAPEPAAHSTLSLGSTGPEVKTLQARLLALGYALPLYGVDGDFGPETETAVRAYQRANGLEVDGIVGPTTWAKLDADGAAMIGRENLTDKPANDGEAAYMVYTVKPGDTLTKIAIAHRTTAQALAIINGIPNPSRIYAGQKIRVPV